jgi:hypothetical protein
LKLDLAPSSAGPRGHGGGAPGVADVVARFVQAARGVPLIVA